MTCLISKDGKLSVCGGFRRRKYHYFDPKRKYVLFTNSLWYEPILVSNLKRKKFERIDLFVARVKRKLGFIPQGFKNFRRRVAKPMMQEIEHCFEKSRRRSKV